MIVTVSDEDGDRYLTTIRVWGLIWVMNYEAMIIPRNPQSTSFIKQNLFSEILANSDSYTEVGVSEHKNGYFLDCSSIYGFFLFSWICEQVRVPWIDIVIIDDIYESWGYRLFSSDNEQLEGFWIATNATPPELEVSNFEELGSKIVQFFEPLDSSFKSYLQPWAEEERNTKRRDNDQYDNWDGWQCLDFCRSIIGAEVGSRKEYKIIKDFPME